MRSALAKEEAVKLLKKLSSQLDEAISCAICLEELNDETSKSMLRKCMHSFCQSCLSLLLQHSTRTCPLCRAPFTRGDIVSDAEMKLAANMMDATKDGAVKQNTSDGVVAVDAPPLQSPKVLALVSDVAAARRTDPTLKCVVFSQFRKCLDEAAAALQAAGVACAQLSGASKLSQRNETLELFRTEDGPAVLLITTRAGGVGLSLTEASRVYMMDLWWNSAVDAQAMDRVHRIGQRNPVNVIRYVCADSIEQSILEMQERKDWLGKAALQRLGPEDMRKVRLGQLRRLFSTKGDT